eukprot:5076273-Lingulodinium_polyedra.AAC.1
MKVLPAMLCKCLACKGHLLLDEPCTAVGRPASWDVAKTVWEAAVIQGDALDSSFECLEKGPAKEIIERVVGRAEPDVAMPASATAGGSGQA